MPLLLEYLMQNQYMSIREPAVAGFFYPANARELQRQVDGLLGTAAAQLVTAPSGNTPEAMIVPHAGYVYSGPIAAAAYCRLREAAPRTRRIVMLGPAHRVPVDGLAIPSVERFATPLGEVPLDGEALHAIAELHGVHVSDRAHAQEHCLEVQLPFLQRVLHSFALVPIVVGRGNPEQVAAVLDALWGSDDTLLIVSSDLSHHLPYRDAQLADRQTAQKILDKSTTLTGEQACGAHAINGLMQARHTASLEVEPIELCNSGDTAGDKTSVVGYGAFILH